MEQKRVQIKSARLLRTSRRRLISLLSVLVIMITAIALMVPAISMTRGELVCDLEEHQHSDACYEQVLACGYDDESAEEAGHEHSDDCYELSLVCEKPEHQHSDACYESEQESGDDEQGADEAGDEGAVEATDKAEAADTADGGAEGESAADEGGAEDADADSGAYDEADADEGAPASDDIAYPAVTLKQAVDLSDGSTLEVVLDADEGVLPEGASMRLASLQKKKAKETIALMKREADDAGIPADESQVLPFDIQLLDAEGSSIEPAGDVRVTVKHPAIAPDSQFTLVRVKYAEDSEHKDKAAVIELTGADPEDSTIEFEAGVFSPRPYGLVYVPAPEDEEATEGEGAEDDSYDGEDAGSEPADDEAENGSSIFIVSGDDEETADTDTDDEEADSESADGETGSSSATLIVSGESDESSDMPARTFKSEVEAADGSSVTVTVSAPEGALPEGTTMRVEPVADDDVLDAAKAEAAASADLPEGSARALAVDITFEDADGNEVEPAKDVHVSMVAKEAVEQAVDDQVAVVHVDADSNAKLVEDAKVAAARGAVSFEVADFSVYALVYTVDFHWEVDGKTYDFSLPGGGFISLTQLVEALVFASLVFDSSLCRVSTLR